VEAQLDRRDRYEQREGIVPEAYLDQGSYNMWYREEIWML
jgi:hypothetical protein